MASSNGSSPSCLSTRLGGKVALITGGASGIGECTARLFSRHGAKVVIADIQDELGQSVSRDIGPSVTYVHCNVTNEDDVKNAVDKVVSDHGRLDIMFNNAGTIEPSYESITDIDRSDFDRVMEVNVTGAFLGIKHAGRVMAPFGRGSIVVCSSVASVMAGGPHGYTTSKHAVLGLVQSAAVDLGEIGIRVNAVSPHLVSTPLAHRVFKMTAEELEKYVRETAVLKGVTVTADDIAEAVLYLGSDESRYVSGQNLLVDGAFSKVNAAMTVSGHSS